MAKINKSYESIEEVPDNFKELYEEREGKAVFVGISEFTQLENSVATLKRSLESERKEHKATKAKFQPISHLDVEEVTKAMEEIETLRARAAAGGDKPDQAKIDEVLKQQAERLRADYTNRENKMRSTMGDLEKTIQNMKDQQTRNRVATAIREMAVESKLELTAIDDAILHGQGMFVVGDDETISTRDGLSIKDWLSDMQTKKPHWWPRSEGGNASGRMAGFDLTFPGGVNPWSKAGWNLGQQSVFETNHGEEKAKRAANLAGAIFGSHVFRPNK